MDTPNSKHEYEATVSWIAEKRASLAAPGMKDVEVATPPDFGGHPGLWSPEHLFVASVNACVLTTFLAIAEKSDLAMKAYRSTATGTLDVSNPLEMAFETIVVRPEIIVGDKRNGKRAERILKRAASLCLVSRSISTPVSVEPRIRIDETDQRP